MAPAGFPPLLGLPGLWSCPRSRPGPTRQSLPAFWETPQCSAFRVPHTVGCHRAFTVGSAAAIACRSAQEGDRPAGGDSQVLDADPGEAGWTPETPGGSPPGLADRGDAGDGRQAPVDTQVRSATWGPGDPSKTISPSAGRARSP